VPMPVAGALPAHHACGDCALLQFGCRRPGLIVTTLPATDTTVWISVCPRLLAPDPRPMSVPCSVQAVELQIQTSPPGSAAGSTRLSTRRRPGARPLTEASVICVAPWA